MSSEPAAVSSRAAEPAQSEAELGPLLVPLPETPFVAPPSCACCGGEVTTRVAARARSGREILVGYCDECAAHVARVATRRLAALLAATLVGVATALALPILAPWLTLGPMLALTLASVSLPLLANARRPRPRAGHASRGPAARFHGPNALLCERAAWGRELADQLGMPTRPAPKVSRPRAFELAIVIAVVAVLAPWSHARQHPWLRVLNLGDVAIEVSVDGRRLGSVEPSSGESPLAGLEARVPAGRRTIASRSADGTPLATLSVVLTPGERHLYSPFRDDVCFWLEHAQYGRERGEPQRVPLPAGHFWVVPSEVQGWFVPSPPPGDDSRVTGGVTTVLRQGSCE